MRNYILEALPARTRHLIAALHDTFMAAASFLLALYLRLGEDQFALAKPYMVSGTLAFTCICLIVFIAMRLYRGLWRYASLPDMVAIVRAVTIAVAVFSIALFAITRLEGLPRSVPFITWLLLLMLLGGPRVAYRIFKEGKMRFDFKHDATRQIPLLLVGANGNAELFLRDTLRDTRSLYRIVGIIDVGTRHHNSSMHGIGIQSGIENIPTVVHQLERRELKPQRIILADDTLTPEQMNALLEMADNLGLPLGRLPKLGEFKQGASSTPEIRPIVIEDLLGRAQSLHSRAPVEKLIGGKRILVTGAGGSIGSELVRQLAALNPAEILLLDASEHFLYLIDYELTERFPTCRHRPVLADVQNADTLHKLFHSFKPQLVFHAAAVKHVPLSEANPLAALSTNALGTRNVADAAVRAGAEAMVMISTDKAVNPTNVMGASKRLAESYCQALGQSGAPTRFFTVRFGNVLGSHGSVVPLFERQLKSGGPLTVTHPDMVRYFMTIREAVELVLQAAALGAGGPRREAIYVLDMGKPVRILDLATQMIRLSGLKPGKDIEITFTGLRPGEKLFEELFYDAEQVSRTELNGILLAASADCPLAPLQNSLAELENLCRDRDETAAITRLSALVPGFQHTPKAL